jgi:thiol-disulfide isomerase/thioredoxin
MNKLTRKLTEKYLLESRVNKSTRFILFTADWCDACKDINVLFENQSNKFIDNAIFEKIDVDDESSDSFTIEYKILKIPTIVIIAKGKVKKYINEQITHELFDEAILPKKTPEFLNVLISQ